MIKKTSIIKASNSQQGWLAQFLCDDGLYVLGNQAGQEKVYKSIDNLVKSLRDKIGITIDRMDVYTL